MYIYRNPKYINFIYHSVFCECHYINWGDFTLLKIFKRFSENLKAHIWHMSSFWLTCRQMEMLWQFFITFLKFNYTTYQKFQGDLNLTLLLIKSYNFTITHIRSPKPRNLWHRVNNKTTHALISQLFCSTLCEKFILLPAYLFGLNKCMFYT